MAARVAVVPAAAAYNWWAIVPFRPGLLRSTNSFFSDLEVAGARRALLFGRLDVLAGTLFAFALLMRGPSGRDGIRREWPLVLAFAAAVGIGGLFPFSCAEGTSPGCRRSEWHLQLPPQHYAHVVASAVEFLSITAAVLVAWRRTRGRGGRNTEAVVYRVLAAVLAVGYLPLAIAYFTDRWAALVEPIFFVAFTVAAVTEVVVAPPSTVEASSEP